MRREFARAALSAAVVAAAAVTAPLTPAIAAPSPPTISKAFSPTGVAPNGAATVTFTIQNPNSTSSLSGVGFTDSLPANLVVATPNGLSTTCGGTATATAGSGSISLTGGSLAGNGSCTVTAHVTSSATGTYANTTGPVSSTESGTGATSNTATLAVANPPTITKLFSANTVPAGGKTRLSLTINNPNSNSTPPSTDMTLTGVSFSDSLPSGMTVASPANASSDCGGTLTATPGSSTITFSGGMIAPAPPPDFAGGNCNIAVDVVVNGSGTFNNTTGPVSSNESGPGTTSNTASITVAPATAPPTLAKLFGAASVQVNSSTSLTFTVTNPNSGTDLIGVAFTDHLPNRLLVASPANGLTGTCVSSFGAAVTAVPGSGTVSLDSMNLPAGQSCSFSVNVTPTATGPKNNMTGTISASYDDGSGAFVGITGGSASASLSVTGATPPSLSKAFGAGAVRPGDTTSLTFNLANPNSGTVLTGVGFSDTLPSRLTIASPSGLVGTCGGGTISAPPGGSTITLSGTTLQAAGGCSFSINVTAGSSEGPVTNTTSDVSSNEGGVGNPASASIFIASPPMIGAAFAASPIQVGQTTSLTFRIANPNMAQGFTGVGFSSTLPAGIVVASPSGASDSCGGTVSTTSGGSGIALSGGSLPAGAGCTVIVNVTGTAAGPKSIASTPVTASEGGSGNAASASITVIPAPGGTGVTPHAFVVIQGVTVHHDGSTTLTVVTSGPGSIDVLETAGSAHQAGAPAPPLKPGSGRFSFAFTHFAHVGAGKQTLRVKPGKRGKRLVRHHRGKVLLNVWVRFFPGGQGPATMARLHVRLP